ncbi:MAG: WYL domain-containing protein [Nitriliruptorales bacterium]|nr:WYL domain-containing protein [Nitriliruptorales bacterium]
MSRPGTLERLERILVLVPWLLDHPGVEIDEVTQRFGMTRADLVRDLDVLGFCGLPGYGGGDLIQTNIFGDRVSVRLADFFRRPLRLSVRQALSLLLAARALADVPGVAESEDLLRAARRLEDLLGAEPRVAVDLSAPGDDHLPLLREAVERRRVVRLRYRSRSKQETTQRDVEPWAVLGAHGAWYLQGWCRLAAAPRDFRLDRIVAAHLTEAEAAPAPDRPPPPAYRPAEGDLEVVLDLRREAWWLPERSVVDEVRQIGEIQRVRLRTPSLEWVARLVLGRAPAIQVVQPPDLAERVRILADQTLARYQGDQAGDH